MLMKLMVALTLLFFLAELGLGNHRRRRKPRPPRGEDHLDYYYYGLDETTHSIFKDEGNVTVTRHCPDNRCDGVWGAWQSWSECDLKLPGNDGPRCHNTFRIRRRFCAQSGLCKQMLWEYCLHEPTCFGTWSEWSDFDGNCTNECTTNVTRTRICYHNGLEAPGLCLGSGTKAKQTEVITCHEQNCSVPPPSPKWMLGLMIGGGALLLLIIFVIATVCFVTVYKGQPRETELVSSSSFLLGHWRIISRRFTRRTCSEPQRLNHPEVAIGSNYSAVHVYESPNDYAQVLDTAQTNVYEETLGNGTYRVPFTRVEERSRSSTVVSEEKYAIIGPSGAYASMEPLGDLTNGDLRKMKRFHSCDDILTSDENMNRSRPLPGSASRTPLFRGASEFPVRKNAGLYKKPSNAGGVLAKITKKRKITMERYNSSAHSSTDFPLEEDRYGYLVPNSNGSGGNRAPWQRQKTKTFSGFEPSSQSIVTKSASLPTDMDTYVTMKSSIHRSGLNGKGYRD